MIIYHHQNNVAGFAGNHVYLSPVWIQQRISVNSATAPAAFPPTLAMLGVGYSFVMAVILKLVGIYDG